LRSYVLTPLTVAEQTAEREYTEIGTERLAFERFRDCLDSVDTEEASHSTAVPRDRSVRVEERSQAVEQVRDEFRETVMSVDHYDELYGESLDEHVSAELSMDAAVCLKQARVGRFTDFHRTALANAVETAIDGRATYGEMLETERESLAAARTALTRKLDEYDTVFVSDSLRCDLESTLDEIATNRQETVQRQCPRTRTDGHEFCAYLYHDADWTYPVLTALARFRQSAI
jgi:hypothetical protein